MLFLHSYIIIDFYVKKMFLKSSQKMSQVTCAGKTKVMSEIICWYENMMKTLLKISAEDQ